jgi:mRNA-degrading endonuclease toxin of MazEF toxin-antitoxin module
MTQRGDIVIVQFPYAGGGGGKTRPAVVVQCDRLNGLIQNTVVAMITGNLRLVGREPTQLLIDPSLPEGQASGLSQPSAVTCVNLITIRQGDIQKTLGRLSPALLQKLNDALKAALELP